MLPATEVEDRSRALARRVRELTALHQVTRALLDRDRPALDRLRGVVGLVVEAFADETRPDARPSARIEVGALVVETPGHAPGARPRVARFRTADGEDGRIELGLAASGAPAGAPVPDPLLDEVAELVRGALDRDRSERALRAAHASLQLALAATTTAVCEWDVVTDVVTWSAELAAMTGFTGALAAPLAARAHHVHPDDRDRLFDEARRVARGGELGSLVVRISRPDGGWREVSVHARPVGDQRRVVVAFVDVSARLALEEDLRHAQKLEVLGLIAGGVAHDFNNLLSVVLIASDLVAPVAASDPGLAESVVDLQRAAQHGLGLTRQLLSFSRTARLQPSLVELGAAARELAPVLERLVRGRAELRLTVEPGGARVWAERGQLDQLLLNLVVNARDAVGPGGQVAVTVRAAHDDELARAGLTGPHAAIVVQDDGAGIDPAVRPHLFDPFVTSKRPGEGAGFGLAVVANVARRWRGHVLVDSEPGAGSRFTVLLPRHLGPSRPPALSSAG